MTLLPSSFTFAQYAPRTALQRQVRSEFLHAWRGYKQYAWGHDDLKPLSKTYHDWYAEPLLMTPVDALDTMILMGLNDDAKSTRGLRGEVFADGGVLLVEREMTGDKRLLNLAEDLGNRLLPVFNSPTGLPYRYVNLKTGAVRGNVTNPAEAGTLLIEFGTLARLTHRQIFYDKAKRVLVEIYNRRSPIGLVGTWINVETGQWTDTDSHISGGIDSYYEYLWKGWLLFGDKECLEMWNSSIPSVQPDTWGVMSTLGNSWNAWRAGKVGPGPVGYWYHTSSVAPANSRRMASGSPTTRMSLGAMKST